MNDREVLYCVSAVEDDDGTESRVYMRQRFTPQRIENLLEMMADLRSAQERHTNVTSWNATDSDAVDQGLVQFVWDETFFNQQGSVGAFHQPHHEFARRGSHGHCQ